MREFLREHSGSVVVSVVLHGLLVAALILTAVISTHRKPPSLQPLPIDAVVVDSKIVHAAQRAQDEQAARARAAEAEQAAEAKQAADAKRAADERARQDREAELRRQMADEEHRQAVESGPLRDSYIAKLRNRIQHAWIKPPSASVGLDCLVEVTQVPGGEVTGARVTQCNGDAVARQSIENAVYRASPLPDPPDPALFERNFVIRFKPDE